MDSTQYSTICHDFSRAGISHGEPTCSGKGPLDTEIRLLLLKRLEKTRSTSVTPLATSCSSLPHGSSTSACQLIAPAKSCTRDDLRASICLRALRSFHHIHFITSRRFRRPERSCEWPCSATRCQRPLLEHLDSWRRTSSSHRTFQPWADNMVYLGSTVSRAQRIRVTVFLIVGVDPPARLVLRSMFLAHHQRWRKPGLRERCGGDERGERDEQ